jgi:hypothetical protein
MFTTGTVTFTDGVRWCGTRSIVGGSNAGVEAGAGVGAGGVATGVAGGGGVEGC